MLPFSSSDFSELVLLTLAEVDLSERVPWTLAFGPVSSPEEDSRTLFFGGDFGTLCSGEVILRFKEDFG